MDIIDTMDIIDQWTIDFMDSSTLISPCPLVDNVHGVDNVHCRLVYCPLSISLLVDFPLKTTVLLSFSRVDHHVSENLLPSA